ncbi:hypothetical protein [Streptomyces mutabilis]|uniref:Uncharacterized protein n=1 Tax=Streptomyces mutabilis TaxID=67332 RepID=A0A086MSU5_9ACTN|nr:hypothetical protein [Streptomyces mutabilis]KFG71963.1 hypothetical protein FM21_30865 [Streptomyces mutabilis]
MPERAEPAAPDGPTPRTKVPPRPSTPAETRTPLITVAESAFRLLDEAVRIHGKDFGKLRMLRVLTGTS